MCLRNTAVQEKGTEGAIAFQENKLGFVLLCLTNESYPSFCARELWTFYQRLPRESVENNYLAFVVQ